MKLFGRPKVSDDQQRRLPPGQYLTQKWPVLHYGSVPSTDLATWDFRVWGEVEAPFTFTWDEFRARLIAALARNPDGEKYYDSWAVALEESFPFTLTLKTSLGAANEENEKTNGTLSASIVPLNLRKTRVSVAFCCQSLASFRASV